MCTVLIQIMPGHKWPLLVAGNRDEMADRAALAPARHWPDRPEVVAGLDTVGGGTWMGLNEHGVFAVILNRSGTLGPQTGKRSRGELPLEALEHADAESAVTALSHLDGASYRAFNMIVADNTHAFWIKSLGHAHVAIHPIKPGRHMLTSHDLDDQTSTRIFNNWEDFLAAPSPDPDTAQWESWTQILTQGKGMTFKLPTGYGTVSSALIALPGVEQSGVKPVWLYRDGPPDTHPYLAVRI